MRSCPNCSEEIQDDAVFCRHCHTELDPSPTLTSMRKCPYCAEWVEITADQCKYCGQALLAADSAHAAPFVETSTSPDDFAQTLRQSLLEDDSEEAAAIAAAAAEFIAEDPGAPIAGVEDEAFEEPGAAFSDFGNADSIYDEPQSELRRSLYDDPQDEAIPSAEDAGAEPQSELRRSLYDEPFEGPLYESFSDEAETALSEEPQSELRQSLTDEPALEADQRPLYDEPQADLQQSLYDEPLETSSTYDRSEGGTEYVEPIAGTTGSGLWMAGAEEENDEPHQDGTGALDAGSGEFGRSVAGTEGVSELRADVSGPPGKLRRNAGKIAKVVIVLALIGAAAAGLFVALFGADGWGVFALSEGSLGAVISDAMATDIPADTPIPLPTSTLRSAPTLPPEIESTEEGSSVLLPPEDGTPLLPPEDGTPSSQPGCVSWESITVEDEGSEACVYGVIKRWWTGDEIPFIAIFSEEEGTFSIIDRTTRYPVGPDSCIMARGTVEVMGGVRPNIDANGFLEDCPEEVVEG
jgi:Double zinc ribbon